MPLISLRIFKDDEMGKTCSTHRDAKLYKTFVGKPEGMRPTGRPRCRWEDNIRMDLREIGWEYVDWMHLTQDRDKWRAVVNTVMNSRILLKVGNFLTT
jgi:hypothetical protein